MSDEPTPPPEAQHSPMQRLFTNMLGSGPIPTGLSKEEFAEWMEKKITEFEDSGYLKDNAFEPITGEEEFLEKLRLHKNDLMVVKFWKRRCIPCLSLAEMYKEAERRCQKTSEDWGKRVHFYSVDIKSLPAHNLVQYQMVEGTPTIQTFAEFRQIGEEVQANRIDKFMHDLHSRIPKQK